MVLFAVEGVIVPIQAEPYALQGLQDLVPMLDKMSATAQLYKIVVNMYRANTQLHQNILKEISDEFPGRIAKQTIRQTIQLAEAAREGLSIFEYAPASIGLSPDKVKLNVRARNVKPESDSGEAGQAEAAEEPEPVIETAGAEFSADRPGEAA
jgi:cellulose biosynthesis protein BcsQ